MNIPITKVICKKPIRSGGQKIYVDFKVGVEYSKFILETEDTSLDYSVPYTYKYIYIYDETGGLRFHLNKNLDGWGCENPTHPNFYDFFYDQREIRKLKLEKIKQLE
jgi:hypothetical protein